MKELKLCDNKLANIGLSPTMINLVDLDLSGNELTVLNSKAILPYSQLNYLSLAGNQLSEISSNLFQQTPNLMVRDLSRNKLDSLPKALKSLASLQTLDISENLVRDADQDALGLLTSLWRLQ